MGTAVAANASANYLGSAIGTILGSVILARGMNPSRFPPAAAAVAVVAIALQFLRIQLNRAHRA